MLAQQLVSMIEDSYREKYGHELMLSRDVIIQTFRQFPINPLEQCFDAEFLGRLNGLMNH